MFILGVTMRDSIVWYRSFMEAVEELPAEDFKRCVMTILKYGLDGEIPQTNGIERTIYIMAKPQLDKNYQKWVNGKSGGRPKNQTKTKEEPNDNQRRTKNNQTETKPKPNVNVNVNDNVNDNVISTHIDGFEKRFTAFCKRWQVTVDNYSPLLAELDFDKLDKAYAESAKFLQVAPVARTISWVIKNAVSIYAGKYKDKKSDGGESKGYWDDDLDKLGRLD